MRTKFNPEIGRFYKSKGGSEYFCIAADENGNAIMQNILSGWTFIAKGCGVYEDGTIDWDYSTGGYFA